MQKLLNVYKPKGFTPLELIKLLKEKFPEYKNEKIGYAGRLDPLAHGVLLLMIGEEATKERDKYLNLSKEYEFEAVFGVATDTYDALGLLDNKFEARNSKHETNTNFQNTNNKNVSSLKNSDFDIVSDFDIRISDLKTFVKNKLGKQTQTYPPFSSKTVHGKPLYLWAKENRLSEIKIPEREIEIYDFKLLEIKQISAVELKKEIMQQIDSVKGDFRQKEIKNTWNTFFANDQRLKTNSQFLTARLKISCSSGTYVRSLVNELGEKLAIGAITLEILRTKVGGYSIEKSLILQK